MLALHSPQAVFSLRHAPSWFLLAFAAGAVNAVAFLACSRFVTHVTGTATQIGMNAGTVVLALDYLIVLGCFVIGALTSTVVIDGRHHQGKRPLYAVPLVVVAAVLASIAFLGTHGVFGPFGGDVESTQDFGFLSILAFAMGLQNAAVATSTGLVVRTTHMTGPATDLGMHLGTALHTQGDARRVALRHAALRAGKIASFTSGGAIGVIAAARLEYAAFFVPAAVVLVATGLSFLSVSHPRTSQELAS
jgi:uncharacterized membrane protein YoaK (UPF0700 family)